APSQLLLGLPRGETLFEILSGPAFLGDRPLQRVDELLLGRSRWRLLLSEALSVLLGQGPQRHLRVGLQRLLQVQRVLHFLALLRQRLGFAGVIRFPAVSLQRLGVGNFDVLAVDPDSHKASVGGVHVHVAAFWFATLWLLWRL